MDIIDAHVDGFKIPEVVRSPTAESGCPDLLRHFEHQRSQPTFYLILILKTVQHRGRNEALVSQRWGKKLPFFFLPAMWSWASTFNIQILSCFIDYLYFMVMVKSKSNNIWKMFSKCLAQSRCLRNRRSCIFNSALWEQDSCLFYPPPYPTTNSHKPTMCLLVLDTFPGSVNICWMMNTWING